MGFFTPSYDKPGKGIDKDAPQKRSFFRFFDIFFRKFWKLITLNLLYLLTALPTLFIVFCLSGFILRLSVILSNNIKLFEFQGWMAFETGFQILVSLLFMIFWGMGPVTAGVTYILRNYAKETHAWLWSDFIRALKQNFKQALGVLLIDIFVFVAFCVAFVVYGNMPGMIGAMRYIILVIAFIYTLMHPYIYQMMVTFEMKFKDLYRNALLFAIGKLPSNVLVMLILLFVHLGGAYFAIFNTGGYSIVALLVFLLLECFILLSFSGLLVNFNVYPKLKLFIPEEKKVKSLSEED